MNEKTVKIISRMNLSSHSTLLPNFAFFYFYFYFLASGVISEINLTYYFISKTKTLVLQRLSHVFLVKHVSNSKEFNVILCILEVLHVLHHQIWYPLSASTCILAGKHIISGSNELCFSPLV